MIKAYYLSTGADGQSHVVSGRIAVHETVAVESIHFEESPPHSSLEWHVAPTTQYVITLSGTLEFVTQGGEIFTIKPGDVLIAEDTTGAGHKWRLIDDQPWKRAYVLFKKDAKINFQADSSK